MVNQDKIIKLMRIKSSKIYILRNPQLGHTNLDYHSKWNFSINSRKWRNVKTGKCKDL